MNKLAVREPIQAYVFILWELRPHNNAIPWNVLMEHQAQAIW